MRALIGIAMTVMACRAPRPVAESVSGSEPESESEPEPESEPESESEPGSEPELGPVAVFTPSPLYIALFRDGARHDYTARLVGDGGFARFTCTVSAVAATLTSFSARVDCRDDAGRALPSDQGWPSGTYLATASGLYRSDLVPAPEALLMTPLGEPARLRTYAGNPMVVEHGAAGRICRVIDGASGRRAVCFRAGAGLVASELGRAEIGGRVAVSFELAALHLPGGTGDVPAPERTVDAPALRLNELATAGTADDWFEVVNVSSAPVELSDYVFVDRAAELARVAGLEPGVLEPGEHHQQRVTEEGNGFRLGRAETLTLYRAADLAVVDRVTWTERDAPDDGSFARIPDGTGKFRATTPATPGDLNAAP